MEWTATPVEALLRPDRLLEAIGLAGAHSRRSHSANCTVPVFGRQSVDSYGSSETRRGTTVPNVAASSASAPPLSQPDHNFAPDFAWALVGGLVVLGVAALLYALVVTWGGFRVDLALPVGQTAPLSSVPRELAALFLGGALFVLVARSLTGRVG